MSAKALAAHRVLVLTEGHTTHVDDKQIMCPFLPPALPNLVCVATVMEQHKGQL